MRRPRERPGADAVTRWTVVAVVLAAGLGLVLGLASAWIEGLLAPPSRSC